MSSYKAIHTLHVGGKIVRAGETVELSDADAKLAAASGSISDPDGKPLKALSIDGPKVGFATFREMMLTEFEQVIPAKYAEYEAAWNRENGIVLRKERDDAPAAPSTPPPAKPSRAAKPDDAPSGR